ncbi:MAG: pyruvate dehydrogenase [Bdellovibrionales bacterium]|nr:pyruvate dehydrogenase [Bdellovibrionales bacterium]
MIHIANSRKDKEKGDPKVGGHQAGSASSLHILGALHLAVKTGYDHMAIKPHTSPTDHSYNYLLNLLLDSNNERLSPELAEQAMYGLRKYSKNGEPVFQSYHSHYDPDHHNFLPSGTVGIPPVNAGYLALAYRYAREHGYEIPDAHFWCLLGDSEFREGSLYEAMPDFGEREIGAVTWIVDYNRQSLDGHRITNKTALGFSDDVRLERTAQANGWDVIQIRHGKFRRELFTRPKGDLFQKFLEQELQDYELQAILLACMKDPASARKEILENHPKMKPWLDTISDADLAKGFTDFGGHDFETLIEAFETCKKNDRKPTLVIAHTLKGWGLKSAAAPGNHSSLLGQSEIDDMMKAQGLAPDNLFGKFASNSPETKYLEQRGNKLLQDMQGQWDLKKRNLKKFQDAISAEGTFPAELNINTKMVTYPHTQWMLGQLTAKLTRIANTPSDESKLTAGQKALAPEERPFKIPGELLVSMAPDVGTSTNLNPAMDGKVFGAVDVEDYETQLAVKDTKLPDLVPGEDASDRFLRFEIAEQNVMSCVGSFGKIRDTLGIPLIPLMTVYDFFLKRALDQFFYNLYWKSSFILVGTPSGVTLSPEGAQHGWKSDIQIPNQITWEPFFCVELDWIMTDAIRRHVFCENEGRTGTFIRGVTRGADQTLLMQRLKRQARFKVDSQSPLSAEGMTVEGATPEQTVETQSEADILSQLRTEVLAGAYYLINYQGYAGYEPGDNVVHIFSMGAPSAEAVKASDTLLARGIYANVIVVTNSDLVCGINAHNNDYDVIRNQLGINSSLHLQPYMNGSTTPAELVTLAGRRIPIVSVHDGEPGLLDNIGSIIGVRHEPLAVRKHSKCGRPSEIYHFHGIDADAIVEACGRVLSETALEKIQVSRRALGEADQAATAASTPSWRELWPDVANDHHE